METNDVTIEVLKGIRDEVRGLRGETTEMKTELKGMKSELTEVKAGLDEVNRRLTATEMRIATELVGVTGAVLQVRDLLREDRSARTRIDDHEHRIVALEKKVV